VVVYATALVVASAGVTSAPAAAARDSIAAGACGPGPTMATSLGNTPRIVVNSLFDVGAAAPELASVYGQVWGANPSGSPTRLNAATDAPDPAPPIGPANVLAYGFDSLWALNGQSGVVTRVDPKTYDAIASVSVRGAPADVAFTPRAIWVSTGAAGTVTRVDPKKNRVVRTVHVGGNPSALAVCGGSVWVVEPTTGRVLRIDEPTSRVAAKVKVADPRDIVAANGSLWVTSAATGSLVQIDPKRGRVANETHVGASPGSVAAGESALWVANEGDDSIARVDPVGGTVTATVPIFAKPGDLVTTQNTLWVSIPDLSAVARIERLVPSGPYCFAGSARVACTDLHRAEEFVPLTSRAPAGAPPPDDYQRILYFIACNANFEAYAGLHPEVLAFAVVPSDTSWSQNVRTVWCAAWNADGSQTTGNFGRW
jgi:streptogramin lyase